MAVLKVTQTYEIVSHESAEYGDAEEMGFNYNDVEFTFRELVELMKEHPQASSCPNDGDIWVWFTSYHDTDYRSGNEKSTSIHYSRKNPARNAKYWRLAAKIANAG